MEHTDGCIYIYINNYLYDITIKVGKQNVFQTILQEILHYFSDIFLTGAFVVFGQKVNVNSIIKLICIHWNIKTLTDCLYYISTKTLKLLYIIRTLNSIDFIDSAYWYRWFRFMYTWYLICSLITKYTCIKLVSNGIHINFLYDIWQK